jgi:c-di-GMP-related signal transduction protein
MTNQSQPVISPPDQSLGIQKFMARQPIFDQSRSVLGYELLFRTSLENYFHPASGGNTSECVVDNCLLFGLNALTGGRKAFVNFAREALIQDYPMLLPREQIVVEILEDVRPDDQVLAACRRLKNAGYTIALDDFMFSQAGHSLTGFADIIKVDFLTTAPAEREALARQFSPLGIKMLAEKVETQNDIVIAQKMGYSYFQGYFFCKPQMMSAREVPGFKLNYLRMLHAINRTHLDLPEVERILRQEPSLLMKLLRYLNSAYFGLRGQVTSIRHALTLLGENNVRKWTSVVALLDLAEDKPAELIVTSLLRARCCELLARPLRMPERETDLFLLGLLSVMDAVLDRRMVDVLAEMPVVEEVKTALLGSSNRLRTVLDAVIAQELGNWHQLRICAEQMKVDENLLPQSYLQAVQWQRDIFTG